jgi:hypothetical protein
MVITGMVYADIRDYIATHLRSLYLLSSHRSSDRAARGAA